MRTPILHDVNELYSFPIPASVYSRQHNVELLKVRILSSGSLVILIGFFVHGCRTSSDFFFAYPRVYHFRFLLWCGW